MLFAILIASSSVLLARADEVATTDKVTVDFMGASGGMKLYKTADPANFLMVQQEKLSEYTADGNPVTGNGKSWNLAGAGASWSALKTSQQGGVTHYETTFTKTSGSKSFSLAAHLAKGIVTIEEPVPCSGCSSGSGSCKASSGGACADPGSDGTCASGETACTKSVALPKDQLKFSVYVSGWSFSDSTNRLHYALELKQKDGTSNPAAPVAAEGEKTFKLADGGTLVVPTTGTITGGSSDTPVDVGISTEVQGSKFIINFDFPNVPSGSTLYYDPTLATSGANGPAVVSLLALALTSITAAVSLATGNFY